MTYKDPPLALSCAYPLLATSAPTGIISTVFTSNRIVSTAFHGFGTTNRIIRTGFRGFGTTND